MAAAPGTLHGVLNGVAYQVAFVVKLISWHVRRNDLPNLLLSPTLSLFSFCSLSTCAPTVVAALQIVLLSVS